MIIPRWFTDLQIRYKLFLTYSTVLLLVAGVGTVILDSYVRKEIDKHVEAELKNSTAVVINMVRAVAATSIKNHLRALAYCNRATVDFYYRQYMSGNLTEAEAKEAARSVLLAQKIGKTGYVFAWDIHNAPESVILVVHPKIQGQDVAKIDFVQESVKLKNGYLEYRWQNPDEKHAREKAMYLAFFEPWQWIIAVSSYKQEFLDLMDVNDLRSTILAGAFGRTGYGYIIDSGGNVIIHPTFKGNAFDLVDEEGRLFIQEICSKKIGKIEYSWKNPGESDFRAKLVFFDYIPEYDWIIAASSYKDEFAAPLYAVRFSVIVAAGLIVLLVLAISFKLASYINAPLQRLVDAFKSQNASNLPHRLSVSSKDEIGHLTLYFNQFMDNLIQEQAERNHAEDELRESQRRLLQIIEFMPDAILVTDKYAKVLAWNRAMEAMTGVRAEEMIGKGNYEYSVPFYGVRRPILVDLALNPNQEMEKRYTSIRRRGDIIFGEAFATSLPTGDVHLSATATVLRDSKGEVIAAIECIRDNTERRLLEDRLQRAEKMEALGTLAGGVAHDLNNVLGIVVGYSELLLNDSGASSSARSKSMEILKGGQRAAAIVQDLLTLARRGVSNRKVLNLNDIVLECQSSPELAGVFSYHPDVRVKIDLEEQLLNISGSAVHLGKSLMNLVSNAAEAMPEGGVITIKTWSQYLDKPVSGYDEVREGDYVVLSVSDTGEGIPASDLKRIFEPFYTKKVMGRSGTGLGLAVIWGTVKDHSGYINVESQEGKGTIFTLYFPVTRAEITREQVPIAAAQYMGNSESILIVDDVKEQRELACAMLKKLNYTVVSVSGGEEAVEYLKQNAVDLVVLDMIMDPGMDGLDTYAKIIETLPHPRAIIVSGFSETERVSRAQALGAGAYVKKPYILEKLGLAVRKELDRPA
jgi:two-component system, cell cycle sensor histidine kinase and response regulator CckA